MSGVSFFCFKQKPAYEFRLSLVGSEMCIMDRPLLVANLTVATHLLGTRWCPSLKGAVLLLEDVGEAPYRIDRMLTHSRRVGAFQQLAGLAVGSFVGLFPIHF